MTRTSPGAASATPVGVARPSAKAMMRTVTELSGERYNGRRFGTAGGEAAARWLARQLVGLHASTQIDPVPMATVREVYATPTMELSKATGLTRLRHRRDFAEHLASSDLS